jgi:hypothetical protein
LEREERERRERGERDERERRERGIGARERARKTLRARERRGGERERGGESGGGDWWDLCPQTHHSDKVPSGREGWQLLVYAAFKLLVYATY